MAADHEETEQFSTVDTDMAQERPASDPVAMERARARIERAMFGRAAPARLGRYEILDPIAGGGMGLVYAAYDPELDRKVALKVLHPGRHHDHRAHERLLKEARALARLDHPNVVKVHDVLSHDGQVVVVMALLEGRTLAAWETEPRRWPELVAAYLQAGDGLAAAHSVDVVHRDFKPGNAIISPRGEVRVLDFGLARVALAHDEAARPGIAVARALPAQTVSGAFVGTLAYASPEQLGGDTITAASDQFSFCVALHRAIEGVLPFAGDNAEQLLASIRRGSVRMASGDRRVPSWLRRAVRRGLALDPADRFGSIQILLDELRRPRGWKRWRWPSVSGLLVAGAVLTMELTRSDAGAAACEGGAVRFAGVWDAARRAALAGPLAAIPGPYARDVEARVLGGLDAQVRDATAVHRAACLAHRRGDESSTLLDRKMRCLDRQRDEVAAAVAVLQRTTSADVAQAVDVVVGIPPPAWCADSARVLEEVEPPPTVALDRKVRDLRARISEAAALDRAGRNEEAAAVARAAIDDAEPTLYQPMIAEAELQLGRILIGQKKAVTAAQILRKACDAALATGGQSRLAVEAGARLLYVEGIHAPDLDRLQRDLLYLEPMSRALIHDRFARPLLLNNVAEIYRIARRPDDARRYLERAREALGGEPADIELTIIDRNLAMLTPDPVTRMELSRSAWIRTRDALGDNHLRSLQAKSQYALFHTDVSKAHELVADLCVAYRRFHAPLLDLQLECELTRGFVASESGARDDAEVAYQWIVDATASSSYIDHVVHRELAAGELALLRGQLDRAVPAFQAVIEARGRSEQWWERQQALQAELGLGLVAMALSATRDAVRHLDTAASGYAEIVPIYPAIIYLRRLERARSLLVSLRQSPERHTNERH
ncbi:MAG TPA: serine/threonine-protein kinase [Kofleriaceae bacterium]|jgi:tetratricopeptide (TPR) repeat protein|nr:serine/threonine-protein kinase [Kofleriaceae bacterium]